MKILLIGHACSPYFGSEPGITWNWAWELAESNDVWLIAHPQFRDDVEGYLADQPIRRLQIHWLSLPHALDPWNPGQGERGIRIHYLLWQKFAFRLASRLHDSHAFDLVHHMSWNTLSVPPTLWRLPAPFVWGPVGGGQVAPWKFRRYFGRAWPLEFVRTVRVKTLPYLQSLRSTVRNCDLLFATNQETASLMKRAGAREVRLFLDVGVPDRVVPATPPRRPQRKTFTLLWAGRLEPRKGLPLALEAMTQVTDLPVRLLVAGNGPLRAKYEQGAKDLGIEETVEFLGRVDWQNMTVRFLEADAFIFTSLRDSSGTVVVEAMAHALPVVSLNHQGVGFVVPPEAGIKVSVSSPAETVSALSEGIRRLVNDPRARSQMGAASWESAREHVWSCRAERMMRWYEEMLQS